MMWSNLINDDANKDGQVPIDELPEDLIWQIAKELSKDAAWQQLQDARPHALVRGQR